MICRRTATLLATALAAGWAIPAIAGEAAPTTDLAVNGTAVIRADLQTFVGSDSMGESSAGISGLLSLSSSDFTDFPGDLQLVGLQLSLDPAAVNAGSIDGGEFLGSVDSIASQIQSIGLPAATMPVDAVDENGVAVFSVPFTLGGEAFATYNLIGIDPATDRTIDLATVENVLGRLEVTGLDSAMGQITAQASIFLDFARIPFEPGLVEIVLSGSSEILLEATGEDPNFNPIEFCSIADLAEPCGTVDLADIGAFVNGFSNNEPVSDLNRDGLNDLLDIGLFVTGFTSNDCPGNDLYYCYYGGPEGLAAIQFHEGNGTYAFGRHNTLTAGVAGIGAALMLGFGSFRRKFG